MLAQFRFESPMSATMTATDLQERVEQVQRDLDKDPPQAPESFGKKLSEAVKQRVNNRRLPAGIVAQAATSSDESFTEKVTKAVKEQTARRPDSRKATEDRAEQERSRYGRGGLQRRVRNTGK
jgi:hypothetical protein